MVKNPNKPNTKFAEFADYTIVEAGDLGNNIKEAVQKGWEEVGVTPKPIADNSLIQVREGFA